MMSTRPIVKTEEGGRKTSQRSAGPVLNQLNVETVREIANVALDLSQNNVSTNLSEAGRESTTADLVNAGIIAIEVAAAAVGTKGSVSARKMHLLLDLRDSPLLRDVL
jgi:hypothetical protein